LGQNAKVGPAENALVRAVPDLWSIDPNAASMNKIFLRWQANRYPLLFKVAFRASTSLPAPLSSSLQKW